jgi:hypothetical protein
MSKWYAVFVTGPDLMTKSSQDFQPSLVVEKPPATIPQSSGASASDYDPPKLIGLPNPQRSSADEQQTRPDLEPNPPRRDARMPQVCLHLVHVNPS